MKQWLVLGLVASLAACPGGASGDFTLAQCQAFTTNWLEYGNLESVLPAEQMTGFPQGLPAECTSRKMGLGREELDCGAKANNLTNSGPAES